MEVIYFKYKKKQICTLEELKNLYLEYKSVWIVAKKINASGQTVHSFLKRHNLNRKRNKDLTEVTEYIKNNYLEYKNNFNVNGIATKFNLSEITIYRIAKKLGLTSDVKLNINDSLKAKISKRSSENAKNYIKINGHPKGFLGGKHTNQTKIKLSLNSKKNWDDPNSVFNSQEFKQKQSDNMSKFQNSRIDGNKNYTRGKQGYYINKNGDRIFMRSSWELNYAIYLDYLISINEIEKWEYEVDVFWFEKIKRGVRSYKPDFKIFKKDNSIAYHEVKGWMDAKSKTKLNRMRIYHPNIKIEIIGAKEYNKIKKEFKDKFHDWDSYLKD